MHRFTIIVWILVIVFCLITIVPSFSIQSPIWMGSGEGLVLSKARFLSDGIGLGSWNRFWFLGIPGNHIGSPAVPWLLSLFERYLSTDLETSFLFLRIIVGTGVVFSLASILWLVSSFGRNVKEKLNSQMVDPALVLLFTFFMPSALVFSPYLFGVMKPLDFPSALLFLTYYLGDTQSTIAYPIVLLCAGMIWRLVNGWNSRIAALTSVLVGLVFLINSSSVVVLLLWMVVLIVSSRFLSKPSMVLSQLVLRLIVVLLIGMALVSFWYTPYYWVTFVGSPSLGGKPFYQVVLSLVQVCLRFFPVIFGVIVAKKLLFKKQPLLIVGFVGLLVFGGMTIVGLIADPDFWMDYSKFGRSLDLSMGMLVVGLIREKWKGKVKKVFVWLVIPLFLVLLLRYQGFLSKSILFRETSEHKVASALEDELKQDCEDLHFCSERGFLSGSSVFWLNTFSPISQVRGGNEMGSVNDWWTHGAYQVREGREAEFSRLWLEALGVRYLVIHDENSSEVFHDFKYPTKFSQMDDWEKIWEESGDSVYRNTGSMTARLADKEILDIPSIRKGDDEERLGQYVSKLREPVSIKWNGTNRLLVHTEVQENEVIRIAVSYTPFWRVLTSSLPVTIRRDSLGLLILEPKFQSGALMVEIEHSQIVDVALGFVFSFVGLLAIINHKRVFLVKPPLLFG